MITELCTYTTYIDISSLLLFIYINILLFLFYFPVSEENKFDKGNIGRLSKTKQNENESSFTVFALIYFEYFEKLSLGPVLKYLSISWIL